MAQLKDLIVNGASRFIGNIFGTNATFSGNVMPETDNTQSLGDSTHRWKLYGTITGSLDKTFKIKLNNTQYTYDGSANVDLSTIYAPTAGGTADTQALVGNGATATPKWADINTTLATSTAASSSAGQKLKVTVLGRASSEVELSKATNALYGVTKLTDAYSSTDGTMATTGKALLAAIQTLDVSAQAGAVNKTLTSIAETDGKITGVTYSDIAIATSQITSGTLANARLPARLQEYHTSASNDSTESGWYYGTTGSPFTKYHTSNADFMVWTHGYSTAWASEIGTDFRSNRIAVRNKNNGTWNSWNELASNDSLVNEFVWSADIYYDAVNNRFTNTRATNAWASQIYSKHGFSTSCYISFRVEDATHYRMIGLNSDPATDANHTSIDYCWYLQSNGNLNIYESGTSINSITNHTTYTAGDDFRIEYSNGYVRYYHNGVLCRIVARAVSGQLYADSSLYNGGTLVDLRFGPIATIENMTGATSSVNGKAGLVPAATSSDWAKFLQGNGTWAYPKEAYLEWGGRNFSGSYGCIDAAMVGELGANRLMFAKAAGITIEYSRDGGSTWTDYGATDVQKVGLFSTGGTFVIGKADSTNKATANGTNYQLRVTLNTGSAQIYTALNKFVLYVSTNGSNSSTVTIQRALQSSPDTYSDIATNVSISGWSGYNVVNVASTTTYGNTAASQYGRIRFIFRANGGSTSYNGLTITKIMGFGGVGWTTPSTMAKTGHLYSFDASQNATFPAKVTATSFSGNLTGNVTGNADTATGANITTDTNGVAYYTNTTGTFGNIRAASGAFYSTGQDVKPTFGTLPTAQGGTGNTSYTANRLIYSESTAKLSASGHYAGSTKIAINSSSEPTYNLYVNGTGAFSNALTLTDNSDAGKSTINFSRVGYNYINIPTDATLAVSINGSTGTKIRFAVDNTSVHSYTTNSVTLGTSSIRWKALYVGTADSYGSSTVPVYWNAGVPTAITSYSGNAATATAVKDYNNSTLVKFGYSTSGMTSTSWVGSWDASTSGEYRLRAISPQKLRNSMGLGDTTGALPVANGGTGKTSWTQWGVVYASATTTLANTAQGTSGYVLTAKGAAAPAWDTCKPYLAASTSKAYVVGTTATGTSHRLVYYNASVYTSGSVLYGAAWNDYAEYRETKEKVEPGRCIIEVGDDSLTLSTKRLERGCEIVSDTFGFAIGETDDCKTPIAASGRVLAYPYESREEFAKHIGWPVCSGPNGTVSIMTEEEEIKYPSRIIGTISAVPDYEEWGTGKVQVNGRVWIRIR